MLLALSSSSKCLISHEDSEISKCRYEKGDSWCRNKVPMMPYAYSDSCLSAIKEKITVKENKLVKYLSIFFDSLLGYKGNIAMYSSWGILLLIFKPLIFSKKNKLTKKATRKNSKMKQSLGIITIPPNKRGLVYKKKGKYRAEDKKISLDNEIGYQADLLPEGRHFYYWKWKYDVKIVSPIIILQNEIALVESKIGSDNKIINLGKSVECNDFQNIRSFIENGGEKGKQINVLTEGEYFINEEAFIVITKNNCIKHGISEKKLCKTKINNNELGVVTIINQQSPLMV